MNDKGRAHLDAITAITAQEEPEGVTTLTGPVKPSYGHIKGISAPIGTLLGPNGEGYWYVIDGYDDGAARIGIADKDQVTAAVARAKEGDFYSMAEFRNYQHLYVREQAARAQRLKELQK